MFPASVEKLRNTCSWLTPSRPSTQVRRISLVAPAPVGAPLAISTLGAAERSSRAPPTPSMTPLCCVLAELPHHAPSFRWDIRVTQRIVEMRLSPSENLQRVPGPRALLYYLPRDPALQAAQVPLPRSSRTIWKILHTSGCLVPSSQKLPHPNELRKPLEEIQMGFKDIGSVSPEQGSQGKRQHVVEVCNFVDAGTSIALSAQAREDFHEQTALEAVVNFMRPYGRPRQMTFDRDPRWVGGVSGRDFPSPLRRLLLCLGIIPHICPPHRPDKNAYVERYHRTYGQECIQRYQPTTLQEVTRPSPRRFSSITTGSVLTKDGPVTMS